MSISRSWSTKRSLITVEIPSSKEDSYVPHVVHGPNTTSSPSLTRPGPRHRTILCIRHRSRCHGLPTIKKPQIGSEPHDRHPRQSRSGERPRHGYRSRDCVQPPSNHTRTCNKLPDLHMCTSLVIRMDMDRGILARIDRKLLAGLCDDEALRTLRVPATGAKWSTWKWYCDAVGVSMGRAVAMLIDRELLSVFGEHAAGEWPVFAQRAAEELENREAEIVARVREVDTTEARMRERGERLRHWEDELEARDQQAEFAPRIASRHSTSNAKIGRNERCPCGSGLKYKRCHGATG